MPIITNDWASYVNMMKFLKDQNNLKKQVEELWKKADSFIKKFLKRKGANFGPPPAKSVQSYA